MCCPNGHFSSFTPGLTPEQRETNFFFNDFDKLNKQEIKDRPFPLTFPVCQGLTEKESPLPVPAITVITLQGFLFTIQYPQSKRNQVNVSFNNRVIALDPRCSLIYLVKNRRHLIK